MRNSETSLDWLDPPSNPSDPSAWDRYWTDQVTHGLVPSLFDMFCNDRDLVNALRTLGLKRILCAGNGISMEPRALAAAGFDVVAVDISGRALEISRTFPPSDAALETFFDLNEVRPGGRVEFVVGDIVNATVSPGPFDVVIERRTAQLYSQPDRARVLLALAARLTPTGILFSHCHDGRWRPPAEPRHVCGDWLRKQGWPKWNGGPEAKPAGRVAWLFTSTG